ncbi:DUF2306 domain-containing protein [Paenibacillus sp. YIM B09110]|uniref:DUF2306 domain-containing protein n=1 Tax=Paenibacillus sp. YIM B09110 TaxID=3126102 RepID=UPI00301DA9E7
MKKKNSVGIWITAIFAIGVAMYGFVLYGVLDGRESAFVDSKDGMELSDSWMTWLTVHAISAAIALLIGWLQFVKRLRLKHLSLHRAIGMLYTLAIAVGGVTGLYLSFYASGGISGMLGFGLLAIVWLISTGIGVAAIIVRRDPAAHGKWMLRSYALAFAGVTLRAYLPLSMVLFGEEVFDIYYAVIAWICWIPNLFVAEWLIRRKKRPTARNTVSA